jgi:hypothetical protein
MFSDADYKDDYLALWNYVPGTKEAEEAWARKVAFMAGERSMSAPYVFVRGDVCYDSPIDGRPITNRHARIEDMKRAGCVEYDPGMKQDRERLLKENDSALDASIERHVEESFHKMPSAKKERLTNELAAGITAEPLRLTAGE